MWDNARCELIEEYVCPQIVSRESADDAGIASDSAKPAPEGHDDATPREPVHKPATSLAVTGEEVADQTPVQAKETDEQESQRAPGRHLDADDSGTCMIVALAFRKSQRKPAKF